MDVVYCKNENLKWSVKSLEDFYLFKSIKTDTGQEIDLILSWSRNFQIDDATVIRVYDVEVLPDKVYFDFREIAGTFEIKPNNIYDFEKFCQEKMISFTGQPYENPSN